MLDLFRRSRDRIPVYEPFDTRIRSELTQFETRGFQHDEAPPPQPVTAKQVLAPLGPAISGVTPQTISTEGGTTVTVNGENFVDGPQLTIKFGGNTCVAITFVTKTQLTCISPTHAVGLVDVNVKNGDGRDAEPLLNKLLYQLRPHITSVSPNTGPTAGGTSVTISGSNFQPLWDSPGPVGVRFGSGPIVYATSSTDAQAIVQTPPHSAGAVQVQVINKFSLLDNLANGFTYGDAPPPPPPPPPPGVGGTLSAPGWNGDPHGMRVNTNWPFTLTSTGTGALQLRLNPLVPAPFWSILGRPDIGPANVTISPSSVIPPGGFNVAVGTPYPTIFGDTIVCNIQLVLVDPANPTVALPTYGDTRHQPYSYQVLATYP